jgi:hypothetical protein
MNAKPEKAKEEKGKEGIAERRERVSCILFCWRFLLVGF